MNLTINGLLIRVMKMSSQNSFFACGEKILTNYYNTQHTWTLYKDDIFIIIVKYYKFYCKVFKHRYQNRIVRRRSLRGNLDETEPVTYSGKSFPTDKMFINHWFELLQNFCSAWIKSEFKNILNYSRTFRSFVIHRLFELRLRS